MRLPAVWSLWPKHVITSVQKRPCLELSLLVLMVTCWQFFLPFALNPWRNVDSLSRIESGGATIMTAQNWQPHRIHGMPPKMPHTDWECDPADKTCHPLVLRHTNCENNCTEEWMKRKIPSLQACIQLLLQLGSTREQPNAKCNKKYSCRDAWDGLPHKGKGETKIDVTA